MAYPIVTGWLRLVGEGQLILGQRLDVLAQAAIALASVMLAAIAIRRSSWPRFVNQFLAVLFLAWLLLMIIIVSHGDDFRREFLSVPLVIALLIWRPLYAKDLALAIKIQVIAIPIAVISLLPIFLGSRWPLGKLALVFGVHENITYQWGAFTFGPFIFGTLLGGVAIIGLTLPRPWQIASVTIGGVGIYLADSEGVYLAVAVAIVILVLLAPITRRWRVIFGSAVGGGVALLAGYFAVRNPTGSGRTPIWERYFEVFPESFFTGFGTTGIPEAIGPLGSSGIIFHHGHNMFIDALARTGIIGALCYIAVFSFAGIAAFKAAARGFAPPAALYAFLLVAALLDYSVPLEYWAFASSLLVLGVLVAGRSPQLDASQVAEANYVTSRVRQESGIREA
jgi:O-antigen ligase